MPKKTKRKVSTVVTPAPAPEVMAVRTTEAPAAAAPARSFNRRTPAAAQVEFNPDYSYVIKDLKRIGALAGTFFVILIALSFILPMFQH
jgi:hypothetical protein